MTMFNVVFTALAPLVVGWFDRDLDKRYGERFPLLYREGCCRCTRRTRTCLLRELSAALGFSLCAYRCLVHMHCACL